MFKALDAKMGSVLLRGFLTLLLAGISIDAFAQPLRAIIDTSKGEIVVELNARAAPTTVASFANLAMRGFYDGLTFHRLERSFRGR